MSDLYEELLNKMNNLKNNLSIIKFYIGMYSLSIGILFALAIFFNSFITTDYTIVASIYILVALICVPFLNKLLLNIYILIEIKKEIKKTKDKLDLYNL